MQRRWYGKLGVRGVTYFRAGAMMTKLSLVTALIFASVLVVNSSPLMAQSSAVSTRADQALLKENAALRRQIAALRKRVRQLESQKGLATPTTDVTGPAKLTSNISNAQNQYGDTRSKAALAFAAAPPSWAGFYVGGTAGTGWGSETNNVAFNKNYANLFSPVIPGSHDKRVFGGIAGVEAGYDLQYNWLVAGIVADFSFANINGSTDANETFIPSPNVLCIVGHICSTRASYNEQQSLKSLATVRGRMGFTATPSWLIYGTGGLAVGHVEDSVSVNIEGQDTSGGVTTSHPAIVSGSISQNKAGWVVGGGTEYMLTSHLTGKLEYLYYDLGSVTVIATNPLFPTQAITNIPVRGQFVRAGVDYRF